ncbi:MAG: ABC transporter substrate-binding protein [Chloroflexi bacterium]|nr:ABC transporter substrate-binding protein [Ktedonobacteraceae bacterium]MBV8822840.1 ABC transporter substrate-binding protein [Ktedonobacteraceae bacterium]MBV9020793.1 ABC transporter substrate-binding protein [Ktedonobacteraceae bacterium]MBV9706159.1 ABC transporter substrate-binding protein [Chloroflexota bacterium]
MLYKRRISLSMLLLASCTIFSLFFSACAGVSTGSGSAPDLHTPGTLTVGSDTNLPPQTFANPTGEGFVGFDIDLITAIAKRMGLKTDIVTTGFDLLLDKLNAKNVDVVISAMSITPQRQQQVDFVPYFKSGQSLLVRKGNPKHIKSPNDLCGLNVGVQSGSLEQNYLAGADQTCKVNKKPDIQLSIGDQTDVVQSLMAGHLDATYQDSPITIYYQSQNPTALDIGGSIINVVPEGIAIRKGDTAMFTALQTAFNQLKADGTYHQLLAKWDLESGDITVTG